MAQDQAIPETPGIVIGNTTPKYTAKNPAIRYLTERWVANLEKVFDRVTTDPRGAPKRALEVGCGEGVIADKLHRRFGEVVALDLPDAGLRSWWQHYPGPGYLHADAHHLPFDDDQFDLVVSVEVLEHLTDPVQGLREMARVSRRHVIFSVPREPVFRGCNLVAGRYVSDLGNTPGHLNHWSKRTFTKFVGSIAEVREVTSPFPWTTVWATLPD
ncbi:MAG TPA: class I SAM-dependent methyltransferase [Streptosporangiaceae bacterium]